MKTLQKKLLRTLRTTIGPFLALVVIVASGVASYYGVQSAISTFLQAKETHYEENQLAHHYFHVGYAPEGIVRRIEGIPGVSACEGRLTGDALLLREDGTYATVVLLSYPSTINQWSLFEGEPLDEGVWIDRHYAREWDLTLRDSISLLVRGIPYAFPLQGIGYTPEFMLKSRDLQAFPSKKDSAVLTLEKKELAEMLKTPGRINEVLLRWEKDADLETILPAISQILRPYGIRKEYPKAQQGSYAYVQSQRETLVLAARILPPGFFFVALLIQFTLLRRILRGQRGQIGLLKALGYSEGTLRLMYTCYSLLLSFTGFVLGTFGGRAIANLILSLLEQILDLPLPAAGISLSPFFSILALTLTTGLLAGLFGTLELSRIQPASTFQALPEHSSQGVLRLPFLRSARLRFLRRSLHSLLRNKTRFFVSVFGVALTAALLLTSFSFLSSRSLLLESYFKREHRYDLLIRFQGPMDYRELDSFREHNEVLAIDPFLEVPAILKSTGKEGVFQIEELLLGLPTQDQRNLLDQKGEILSLPEQGILLSTEAKRALQVQVGDSIRLESPPGMGLEISVELPVLGVHKQHIGRVSALHLTTLNQILSTERSANGVMVSLTDIDLTEAENRLLEHMLIDSVVRQDKQEENAKMFLKAMDYFTKILVVVAALMGFSIVYNTSTLALKERYQEFTMLRVLGFSSPAIAGLLFQETFFATTLGVLLGLPLGGYVGRYYLSSISTDTFHWPTELPFPTYFYAGLLTLLFCSFGFFLAVGQIRRIDLAKGLQNRD